MNPQESAQHDQVKDEALALNTYEVRTWNTQAEGFVFPEQQGDQSYFPAGSKRPTRGICFSGGGTVSMAVIAGYLDALQELGLISNIGYISGVSGGTWGTAAYIYNPESDPNRMLGQHYQPAQIPDNELTKTAEGTLAHAICHAPIIDKSLQFEALHTNKTLGWLVPQREVYTMAIGAMFLRPFHVESPCFDIDLPVPLDRRKFFTTTPDEAAAIAKRNNMKPEAFMTMVNDRPYYIMNTTLLAKPQEKGSLKNIYPFEFTPLYAGRISDEQSGVVESGQKIGGSYVETYGFNSKAVSNVVNGVVKAENTYRFELQQPVGTSGSALGKAAQSGDTRLLDIFFPNFEYWNPADPTLDHNGNLVTDNYDFGDGGLIENTGVTSLLARKVQYVGMFLSEMSFYFPENGNGGTIDTTDKGWKQKAFGYNQIAVLFGGKLIDSKAMGKEKPGTSVPVIWVEDTVNRQVFDNSLGNITETGSATTMLDYVINQLKEADAGACIADLSLNVVDNGLFGIKAYNDVKVMLSIIGSSTDWTSQLTGKVKKAVDNGEHNLGDFPNVQVFHQNEDHFIQLNPAQSNLLGNLAYWCLMNQQEAYTNLFSV